MNHTLTSFIRRTITGSILATLFFILFFWCNPFYLSLILAGCALYIVCVEWPLLVDLRRASSWMLTIIYPVMPFCMMVILNQDPAYRNLLLYLIILVSAHDSGSYIVGSLIGKHRIAPSISPGKTWEGFIGGYISACLALSVLLLLNSKKLSHIPKLAALTLVVCGIGLLGDLFESWLKRQAHVKDSGALLPGHGGLLDRFDGIMFAAIVFFLFNQQLTALFLLS